MKSPHPKTHGGPLPVGATSSEDPREAQVSSSFGTLPPLSAIFLITTLWSQMFIVAELRGIWFVLLGALL